MFAAIVGVISLVATVITGAVTAHQQAQSRDRLETQAKEAKDVQEKIALRNADLSTKAARASADEARRAAGTPWIMAVMKKTATKNQIQANRIALSAIDPSKGVRRHYSYGAAAIA